MTLDDPAACGDNCVVSYLNKSSKHDQQSNTSWTDIVKKLNRRDFYDVHDDLVSYFEERNVREEVALFLNEFLLADHTSKLFDLYKTILGQCCSILLSQNPAYTLQFVKPVSKVMSLVAKFERFDILRQILDSLIRSISGKNKDNVYQSFTKLILVFLYGETKKAPTAKQLELKYYLMSFLFACESLDVADIFNTEKEFWNFNSGICIVKMARAINARETKIQLLQATNDLVSAALSGKHEDKIGVKIAEVLAGESELLVALAYREYVKLNECKVEPSKRTSYLHMMIIYYLKKAVQANRLKFMNISGEFDVDKSRCLMKSTLNLMQNYIEKIAFNANDRQHFLKDLTRMFKHTLEVLKDVSLCEKVIHIIDSLRPGEKDKNTWSFKILTLILSMKDEEAMAMLVDVVTEDDQLIHSEDLELCLKFLMSSSESRQDYDVVVSQLHACFKRLPPISASFLHLLTVQISWMQSSSLHANTCHYVLSLLESQSSPVAVSLRAQALLFQYLKLSPDFSKFKVQVSNSGGGDAVPDLKEMEYLTMIGQRKRLKPLKEILKLWQSLDGNEKDVPKPKYWLHMLLTLATLFKLHGQMADHLLCVCLLEKYSKSLNVTNYLLHSGLLKLQFFCRYKLFELAASCVSQLDPERVESNPMLEASILYTLACVHLHQGKVKKGVSLSKKGNHLRDTNFPRMSSSWAYLQYQAFQFYSLLLSLPKDAAITYYEQLEDEFTPSLIYLRRFQLQLLFGLVDHATNSKSQLAFGSMSSLVDQWNLIDEMMVCLWSNAEVYLTLRYSKRADATLKQGLEHARYFLLSQRVAQFHCGLSQLFLMQENEEKTLCHVNQAAFCLFERPEFIPELTFEGSVLSPDEDLEFLLGPQLKLTPENEKIHDVKASPTWKSKKFQEPEHWKHSVPCDCDECHDLELHHLSLSWFLLYSDLMQLKKEVMNLKYCSKRFIEVYNLLLKQDKATVLKSLDDDKIQLKVITPFSLVTIMGTRLLAFMNLCISASKWQFHQDVLKTVDKCFPEEFPWLSNTVHLHSQFILMRQAPNFPLWQQLSISEEHLKAGTDEIVDSKSDDECEGQVIENTPPKLVVALKKPPKQKVKGSRRKIGFHEGCPLDNDKDMEESFSAKPARPDSVDVATNDLEIRIQNLNLDSQMGRSKLKNKENHDNEMESNWKECDKPVVPRQRPLRSCRKDVVERQSVNTKRKGTSSSKSVPTMAVESDVPMSDSDKEDEPVEVKCDKSLWKLKENVGSLEVKGGFKLVLSQGNPFSGDLDRIQRELQRGIVMVDQHPMPAEFRNLCGSLAMLYLRSDPTLAAFLLNESEHVTFRHKSIADIKSRMAAAKSNKLDIQDDILNNMRILCEALKFGKTCQDYRELINVLPQDMTVVQVNCVAVPGWPNMQLVLTRLETGRPPNVTHIPAFSTDEGWKVLQHFENILEKQLDSLSLLSRREFWTKRTHLDEELKYALQKMEDNLLGAFRGMLLPAPADAYLRQKLEKAARKIAHKFSIGIKYISLVEVFINSFHVIPAAQHAVMPALLSCAPSKDLIEELEHCNSSLGLTTAPRQHLILTVCKRLQKVAWENLPILRSRSVSRYPCLWFLPPHYGMHVNSQSVFCRGASKNNAFFVIDPENNLASTTKRFGEEFEAMEGWQGVIRREPSTEEITTGLTECDVFIYLGHGDGAKYISRSILDRREVRAVMLLMGCSSGALDSRGSLEPLGNSLDFLLKGCPAIVGTLWDVTDKDIDRYFSKLIAVWMTSNESSCLGDGVAAGRGACKLPYLIGAAPVIYGLPVVSI